MKQGIEETVVVTSPILGEAMGIDSVLRYQMARRRQQTCISVVRKERLNLHIPFGLEDRAGAVQQTAAGLDEGPQGGQQRRLDDGQLRDVAVTPQPAHIRVPPHNTRGRAGSVQQDCIKRLAAAVLRPPGLRLTGIGCQHHDLLRRLQLQPREVLVDTLAPGRIDVQRRHMQTLGCQFQQVCGLATWRGTGVQHPQRTGQVQPLQQQRCGQLGTRILHRDFASIKPRYVVHRPRPLQQQPAVAHRERQNPQRFQAFEIVVPFGLAQIHPQRHGGLRVVGLQDVAPAFGVVVPQALDPPAGVVPGGHRLTVDRIQHGLALAQKTAQTGIDEAGLRAGGGLAFGGFHGLVHQRECIVRGCPLLHLVTLPAQGQRRAQQAVHLGRWRALGQFAAQRLGFAQAAQHMENQRLHTWAQGRLYRLQRRGGRLPCAYGGQHGGRGLELSPQGHGCGWGMRAGHK